MRARNFRWFVLLIAAFSVVVGTFSYAATNAATGAIQNTSIVVKLVAGLTPAEEAAIITRNGGTETSSVPALRLHVISVPIIDLPIVQQSYQSDPQVQSVELEKTRNAEAIPTDPSYGVQWALSKIGWDSVYGVVAPGASVKVAVLDTGIDDTHPDLAANVIPGTSILDGSNGETDPNGHGTWLAGIVASVTGNGAGIAGIGYSGVNVMPVTVLDANGSGLDGNIISGIIWAADNGADVILMGFSNPDFSQNLQDAIDYAWSKGAVLVSATGNSGISTPTFPAGDRGVIGVSATDPNDTLASGSNYGQDTFLAAPGTNIYTTGLNGSYTYISGTSASSAIVSGVAAFMKAVDPTLTNGLIVGRLGRSADAIGAAGDPNNPTYFGNGRVNLVNALADAGADFIQPTGAAPVGTGGPYVGPYTIAAANIKTWNATGSNICGTINTTTYSLGTQTCAKATGLGNSAYRIEWYDSSNVLKDTSASSRAGNIEDTYTPDSSGTWMVKVVDVSTSTVADSETFTVTGKLNQIITFGTLANKTYGDPDFAVNASASSGLPVSLAASGNCTVSSSTVTITGAGSCTITASQNGNASYNAASNVSQTFTIAKANSMTVVTVTNATYDGNPHGGIATVTGAGGLSESLTVTYSGRYGTVYAPSTEAPTNSGDYTASASYPGDANHNDSTDSKEFTVAKANSTTTVTVAGGESFTYDGNEHPATVAVTGVGSLNLNPAPVYSCVHVPKGVADSGCIASYSFEGDENHNGSTGSKTYTIAKADSTTTVTVAGGESFTYDGNEHPATVAVTGVGGLNLNPAPVYSCSHVPKNVGDSGCIASYSFEGDENHNGSTDSKTYTIAKADSTTTVAVAGGESFTYDGNEHPATVAVTGVGGLNLTPAPVYSCSYVPKDVADSGCKASYSYAGDANHNGSSDSKTYAIAKANSTTTVTVAGGVSFTYDGNTHPATVSITGIGGLNLNPTAVYSCGHVPKDVVDSGCIASYSYAGDSNHNGSSDSKTYTIAKATPIFSGLSSPTIILGSTLTGIGGMIKAGSLVPTGSVSIMLNGVLKTATIDTSGNFSTNFDTGTLGVSIAPYTISYQYAGDLNFNAAGPTNGSLSVKYSSTGLCGGAPGHQILQPINADNSSVFKQKSTVPAKFRVCDANGNSIGSPGVVASFRLIQTITGTATDVVDEAVVSTTPDAAFRWDPTDQQWIFNMNTKSLSANTTYGYHVTLNDGSTIDFKFGLK